MGSKKRSFGCGGNRKKRADRVVRPYNGTSGTPSPTGSSPHSRILSARGLDTGREIAYNKA